MAITITQKPTSPNAVYTKLPYVVSGSTAVTASQFQYVMDIYESGSSELISRVTQTINPSGVAVFDPSRIFQGELQYEDPGVALAAAAVNSSNYFTLQFGEQYGTSPSSSITVYPNQVSETISVFSGYADPNATVNTWWTDYLSSSAENFKPNGWNFNSGSYESNGPIQDEALSNNPYYQQAERRMFPESQQDFQYGDNLNLLSSSKNYQIIGQDDYETITRLKYLGSSLPYTGSSNIACITLNVFDINNTLLFSDVFGGMLMEDRDFYIYGVGPANLTEIFPTAFTGSWSHYEVTTTDVFPPFSTCTGGSDSFYFIREGITTSQVEGIQFVQATAGVKNKALVRPMPSVCENKIRFAWINKYGAYDYYNIYNPVRRSSDIQRENVTISNLNYSSADSSFNINNRGQKDYYTDTQDRFIVDTPLLTKPEAQWLEELIESPSVYIQKGECFIPVIITNSTYQHNNETSRNKLFQYTIEFEPANQPYGDWDTAPTDCFEPIYNPPSPTPTPPPPPSQLTSLSRIISIDGNTIDGLTLAQIIALRCSATCSVYCNDNTVFEEYKTPLSPSSNYTLRLIPNVGDRLINADNTYNYSFTGTFVTNDISNGSICTCNQTGDLFLVHYLEFTNGLCVDRQSLPSIPCP